MTINLNYMQFYYIAIAYGNYKCSGMTINEVLLSLFYRAMKHVLHTKGTYDVLDGLVCHRIICGQYIAKNLPAILQ